jgi:hypothetical protein
VQTLKDGMDSCMACHRALQQQRAHKIKTSRRNTCDTHPNFAEMDPMNAVKDFCSQVTLNGRCGAGGKTAGDEQDLAAANAREHILGNAA